MQVSALLYIHGKYIWYQQCTAGDDLMASHTSLQVTRVCAYDCHVLRPAHR
jgi:hypothetical protein